MEAPQRAVRPVTSLGEVRARASAYGLLSRLVLTGLDEATSALVVRLDVLRDALGERANALEAGDRAAMDELAVEHHALLSMQAFPYESVYMDASGHPGGAVSEAVADFYRRAGFGATIAEVTADHLGVELGALSFLSAARADALEDGASGAAARCQQLSLEFLDQHLLRWLAPFAAACAAQPETFWTTLVELVTELVTAHRRELGEASAADPPQDPEAATLLDDPSTDLRAIATFLCEPRRSGVFFTRHDIEVIGRALKLPTGFGTRAQRLQCVIESAAQYESLPALCRALDRAVAERVARYRAQSRLGDVWRLRAESTQTLLRRLAEAASQPTRPKE